MLKKMDETESFSSKNFPPAELYVEDLEEFFKLFQTTSNDIELEVGDVRLDDPADFATLAQHFGYGRLGSVKIKAKNIWFGIELNSTGARAYISSPTPLTLGVIEKIRLIMKRRRRSIWWHVRKLSYIFPMILLLFYFDPAPMPHQLKDLMPEWGWLVASLLSFWLVESFCKKNKLLIWATQKHLKKSFLETNKDQLAVSLISVFVGAVVGAIITALIKQ